jgi:hypothetical protein
MVRGQIANAPSRPIHGCPEHISKQVFHEQLDGAG